MGDRHNSEFIPSSRIDDYHLTCEAKDNEIINIAKKYNADMILHPGDFWTDSDKKPSNEFVASIARRWMAAGIPVIGIPGNHDLIGNNINSLPNTTTGLLNSLGVFKTLAKGEILTVEADGFNIGITGTPFHKGMDKPENISDYIVSEKTTDYLIHLVHGMLTPYDYGKLFHHTKIEQILDTKADLVLCGHDHVGFGIIEYASKIFVNPGAVVRMSAADKEMSRQVAVCLIEIDRQGITCKLIPLTSALPGSQVLSREHIEHKTQEAQYEEKIKDSVQKLKLGGLSIHDIVADICSRDNIDPVIRKEIDEMVLAKTKTINANKKLAPTGTKIAKIKLHNFQSYTDQEIELSGGYNVILGESNQGKTSILRAIRFVAECKPTGKGLIRKGTDEAQVILTLENGTIIERFIGKKDNGYRIFYPDGTVSEGNTRMVTEVQRVIGWNNLQIGDKEELSINYLKQGDGWFLTSETATDKARILGSLNNTDGADAVIKDVEARNSAINDDIKHENVEIANLVAEIDDVTTKREALASIKSIIEKAIIVEKIYDYLDKLKDYEEKSAELEEIDSIFNSLQLEQFALQIKNKLFKLAMVMDKLAVIDKEQKAISEYNQIINELSCIDSTQALVENVKNDLRRYGTIERWSAVFNAESNNIMELNKQLEQLQRIDDIDTQQIHNNLQKYILIKNALDSIATNSYKAKAADEFIEASHIVERFNDNKYAIQTKIDKLIRLQQLVQSHEQLRQELQTNENKLLTANEAYEHALQDKVEFLREHHTCPWCYSEINDETIEIIIEKSK